MPNTTRYGSDEEGNLDDEFFDDAAEPDIEGPMRSLHLSGARAQPHRAPASTSSASQQEDIESLRAALRQSQQELQASKAQNTRLQEQILDINEDQRIKSSRRRGKDSATPSQSQGTASSISSPSSGPSTTTNSRTKGGGNKPPEHIQRAQQLGQVFCCFFRPWLGRLFVHKYLKAIRPEINYYNFHERYHDEESEDLAIIAEAWDTLHLDELVHSFLVNGKDQKWIINEFVAKVGYEKSKFLNAVKGNLSTLFTAASLDEEDFTLTPAMIRDPKLRAEALKGLGPTNKEDYLCNVLFPPKHRRDGRYLFQCDCIVHVIQSAITGSSSAGSDGGQSASNVKASLWGVTSVTPGLIALSATTLVYFTSSDASFRPPDSKNSVTWDYPAFFEYYLKLIIRHYETPAIKDMMRWLDRRIFGTSAGSFATCQSTDTSDADSETIARNREIGNMFGQGITPDDHAPSTSHVTTQIASPTGGPVLPRGSIMCPTRISATEDGEPPEAQHNAHPGPSSRRTSSQPVSSSLSGNSLSEAQPLSRSRPTSTIMQSVSNADPASQSMDAPLSRSHSRSAPEVADPSPEVDEPVAPKARKGGRGRGASTVGTRSSTRIQENKR